MRRPLRTDEGAVELPADRQHGAYPPDIARRRRALRLPITPAEHAAYDRGEMTEPPATRAQMEATLRRVRPRCAPLFAQALEDILECVARAAREPGEEG